MPHQDTICVIDDHPDNLDLLEQELADADYRVISATNGEDGLELIRRERPDLLLLDIMMPGLNGHEVCRQLRMQDETSTMPIILVTAKTGTHDEVVGLDSGANDYVNKPINIDTLLARIRTQLRIKHLQDELRRNYESFIRLDHARQDTISMLTHDLKSPLMTVSASSKLLLEEQCRTDPESVKRVASLLLKSTQKMQELVEDFLNLARWERTGIALEIEACEVGPIVRDVVDLFDHLLRDRGLRLVLDLPPEPVLVFADPVLLSRIWNNLVSNSIKYNRPDGEVVLSVRAESDDRVRCSVRDTGIGIPADVLPHVYKLFYRPEGKQLIEGTGLGLAVVRAILDSHRSGYTLESKVGEGTEFQFTLRRAPSLEADPPRIEDLGDPAPPPE
jgi:signal transduction histidine kinase